MSNLGNCHKQVADQIGQIVRPIQRFLDDNKKLSVVRKEKIDATWKQLAAQRAELELLEQDYRNKCTIADAEQRKYEETRSDDDLPSMDVMVNLGPRSFTVEDFNTLLGNMQREIKTLVTSRSPLCRLARTMLNWLYYRTLNHFGVPQKTVSRTKTL